MDENAPVLLSEGIDLEVRGNAKWGRNVTFGPNCRKVKIGFGCFIGNDVYIDTEELTIGDYFTLHHGSVIHGKKCTIGHNCWMGHYTILDALGGLLKIGNNVGVGAHSQLWSHMKFGDRLAGCRWYRMETLDIGDDVWLVGHCIVAPIKAESRSMLMVGGVAVKDMEQNRVYGGAPARDMTDILGPQFREISVEEKHSLFAGYLDEYARLGNDPAFVSVVTCFDDAREPGRTYFNLTTQKYVPTYSPEECGFMRFLLYDRAKFVPVLKAQ